ncbi:protein kinase [Gracilaria domingensis]|nr:protein kinase [Gracilaria domingensis]
MESGTEEQLLQLSLTGRLPPTLQKSFDEEKEKGNNAYRRGRYHEAIQHYTTAESINPMSPIPPANRAMVFLKLQDYERAKAEAAIAHELHESLPEEDRNKRLCAKILLRRATANKELLLFALAAEDYQAVLDLEDNSTAKAELHMLRERYGVRPPTPRSRSRNLASEAKIKVVSESNGHTNGVAPPIEKPAAPPTFTEIQDETEILQLSNSTMQNLVLKWSTSEPSNAAEFERSWKSLKSDELAQAKYLLNVVGPQRIERGLLGEILTPQLIQRVVFVLSAAVAQYRSYSTSAARILMAFSQVSRFDMILMFLSSAEKQEIGGLIDSLERNEVTPTLIRSLKGSYL